MGDVTSRRQPANEGNRMNRSLRTVAVAATSLFVAVVIPMSMATPASAATTNPDPVQTVQDIYCGFDANQFCQL